MARSARRRAPERTVPWIWIPLSVLAVSFQTGRNALARSIAAAGFAGPTELLAGKGEVGSVDRARRRQQGGLGERLDGLRQVAGGSECLAGAVVQARVLEPRLRCVA